MANALKNKLLKLEAKLPKANPHYLFEVNVLVPNETYPRHEVGASLG